MQQHFFVCLSIRSLTQSFIRSFDDRSSIVRSSVRSFVHSFIRFSIHFLSIHPSIHPSIRSFVHSFILLYVRSLVRSFIVQTTSHNVVPELISQSSSQIIAQSTDDQK